MYLLDTCVISELVKTKPSAKVMHWIAEQPESALYLSALSIGEIERGIARIEGGAKSKKERLMTWVNSNVTARFGERILPIDAPVAASWGSFQGHNTQTLPVVDGLIAATARVHALAVVTHNVKDFRRFDVPVFDPW
jgi:predicted nucleic acid-binding protein